MAVHKFSELRDRMNPVRREKIAQKVETTLAGMQLYESRTELEFEPEMAVEVPYSRQPAGSGKITN
jgi:hypothetical protein